MARWFAGLIVSGSATTTHIYEFDMSAATLAVQDDRGGSVLLPASDGELGVGSWVLALRLQHEWQPNIWREAAFIPVMRFQLSAAGEVSYAIFDDVLDGSAPVGLPAALSTRSNLGRRPTHDSGAAHTVTRVGAGSPGRGWAHDG